MPSVSQPISFTRLRQGPPIVLKLVVIRLHQPAQKGSRFQKKPFVLSASNVKVTISSRIAENSNHWRLEKELLSAQKHIDCVLVVLVPSIPSGSALRRNLASLQIAVFSITGSYMTQTDNLTIRRQRYLDRQ